MELTEVKAIDTMCRPIYCDPDPEILKESFKAQEMRVMASGTFKGVAKRMGLQPGEEWKLLAGMSQPSLEAMLKEMDEVGVDRVCMDQTMMWSWRDHRFITNFPIDRIAGLMEKSKGKVVGGVGYDPFRIKESLESIDVAVKEIGFKYVWFHPISFGLAPNDRRCYPLYAKCLELGIPVTFQVGHSAEPLPSNVGHPMLADDVAIDFPDLTIVLTHTGWPWIDEWMSMIWRHPNVYGNIGAYYPSSLDPAIIRFIDSSRGQDKILWATNGFGLTRCKKEFLELPMSDKTKTRILRDNALKVFKFDA